jgi:hypothetical protein
MPYESKIKKKILKRVKEAGDSSLYDDDDEKKKRKRELILSRGGKVERSHKKRVGDIVNKNVEKRYSAIEKAKERIKSLRG